MYLKKGGWGRSQGGQQGGLVCGVKMQGRSYQDEWKEGGKLGYWVRCYQERSDRLKMC
jgi:hypothetical protein